SNSANYFTNDYSLTIANSGGGSSINGSAILHKEGDGQLILPTANAYTNETKIDEGWVTIRNAQALGAFLPNNTSDTIQPTVTVASGAALHLKPLVAGDNIDLVKNLILAGTGITHPFALINQKGALMSLGGINTLGGPVDFGPQGIRTSDIQVSGNTGIGVELLTPDTDSQLTVTGRVS